MKRSLAERELRGRVGALRGIEASSLSASNLEPEILASSSYFLRILAKKLTQKLRQVVQNLRVIVKNRDLNVFFLNKLANPLGIELLEL